jgi:hypothetical protein
MRLFTIAKNELLPYPGVSQSFIDQDRFLAQLHINLDHVTEIVQSDSGAFVAMSSGQHFGLGQSGFARLMAALPK